MVVVVALLPVLDDTNPKRIPSYFKTSIALAHVNSRRLFRLFLTKLPLISIPVCAMSTAGKSATDYDRTNATTNYMYRQFGVTFPSQITTDIDADRLDKLRVNYYGETAVSGSTK